MTKRDIVVFCKRENAFTLVEILLVVVIMGVITVLAAPKFSRTYAGIELRKAADDLAYRMRYAQSYAVTNNTLARLEFDPSSMQYSLARQSDDETSSGTFEKIANDLGARVSVPAGIAMSFEEGETAIDFYPDGTIDKRRISFCRKEECVFVSTQKQRGQVHVFRQSDENL